MPGHKLRAYIYKLEEADQVDDTFFSSLTEYSL